MSTFEYQIEYQSFLLNLDLPSWLWWVSPWGCFWADRSSCTLGLIASHVYFLQGGNKLDPSRCLLSSFFLTGFLLAVLSPSKP